jgi:hypothetical protein
MKKEMNNNTLCTRWQNELNHGVHRVISGKVFSLMLLYNQFTYIIHFIASDPDKI